MQGEDWADATRAVFLVAPGQIPDRFVAQGFKNCLIPVAVQHGVKVAAQRVFDVLVCPGLVDDEIAGLEGFERLVEPWEEAAPLIVPELLLAHGEVLDTLGVLGQLGQDVGGAVAEVDITVQNANGAAGVGVKVLDGGDHQAIEGAEAPAKVVPGVVEAGGGGADGPLESGPGQTGGDQTAHGVEGGGGHPGVEVVEAVLLDALEHKVDVAGGVGQIEVTLIDGLEAVNRVAVIAVNEFDKGGWLGGAGAVAGQASDGLLGAVEDVHQAASLR